MTEMILRDAMAKALREALDTDNRTFLMGEDIGAYGRPYAVTRGFLEDYGEDRIRDIGSRFTCSCTGNPTRRSRIVSYMQKRQQSSHIC